MKRTSLIIFLSFVILNKVTARLDPCKQDPDVLYVCGSDGFTYLNPFHLECENEAKLPEDPPIQIVSMGKCTNDMVENCIPSTDVKPVCGSDGITYLNFNALRCINWKKNQYRPKVKSVHAGYCEPDIKDHTCFVSWEREPLCGSDGKTYQNPSQLKCASLTRFLLQGTLMAVHPGRCIEEVPESFVTKKPCYTNSKYDPVCGSDGVTYENLGHFLCENGEKSFGQPGVSISYKGICRNNMPLQIFPTAYTNYNQN